MHLKKDPTPTTRAAIHSAREQLKAQIEFSNDSQRNKRKLSTHNDSEKECADAMLMWKMLRHHLKKRNSLADLNQHVAEERRQLSSKVTIFSLLIMLLYESSTQSIESRAVQYHDFRSRCACLTDEKTLCYIQEQELRGFTFPPLHTKEREPHRHHESPLLPSVAPPYCCCCWHRKKRKKLRARRVWARRERENLKLSRIFSSKLTENSTFHARERQQLFLHTAFGLTEIFQLVSSIRSLMLSVFSARALGVATLSEGKKGG